MDFLHRLLAELRDRLADYSSTFDAPSIPMDRSSLPSNLPGLLLTEGVLLEMISQTVSDIEAVPETVHIARYYRTNGALSATHMETTPEIANQ